MAVAAAAVVTLGRLLADSPPCPATPATTTPSACSRRRGTLRNRRHRRRRILAGASSVAGWGVSCQCARPGGVCINRCGLRAMLPPPPPPD